MGDARASDARGAPRALRSSPTGGRRPALGCGRWPLPHGCELDLRGEHRRDAAAAAAAGSSPGGGRRGDSRHGWPGRAGEGPCLRVCPLGPSCPAAGRAGTPAGLPLRPRGAEWLRKVDAPVRAGRPPARRPASGRARPGAARLPRSRQAGPSDRNPQHGVEEAGRGDVGSSCHELQRSCQRCPPSLGSSWARHGAPGGQDGPPDPDARDRSHKAAGPALRWHDAPGADCAEAALPGEGAARRRGHRGPRRAEPPGVAGLPERGGRSGLRRALLHPYPGWAGGVGEQFAVGAPRRTYGQIGLTRESAACPSRRPSRRSAGRKFHGTPPACPLHAAGG
mmetsp:Transcript_109768/g.328175  ORF Transcript_109768/g.328175 Transcript_109768/m.328175 type:complete len:337 (+) Transcript_109768:532-1542(+)